MADTAAIQEIIQQRQSEIASAQEKLINEQAKSQAARAQLDAVKAAQFSQKALREGTSGINAAMARQRNLGKLSTEYDKLSQRDELLGQYGGEVSSYQEKVNQAKAGLKQAQDTQSAYDLAFDVYSNPTDEYGVFRLEGNGQAQDFYRQMQEGKEDAARAYANELVTKGLADAETASQVQAEIQFNLGKINQQQLQSNIDKLVQGGLKIPTEIPQTETPAAKVESTALSESTFTGGLMPIVSAKGLINESSSNSNDGNLYGLDRVSTGNNISIPRGFSAFGNISDLLTTFKERVQGSKGKEVAVPGKGGDILGFTSAYTPKGETISITRTPTLVEAEKFQAAQDFSIPEFIGNKVTDILATRSVLNTDPNVGRLFDTVYAPDTSLIGVKIKDSLGTVPMLGYETRGTTTDLYNRPTQRQITIPGYELLTPRQVGKAVEFTVGTLPYVLPYVGPGLIFAQTTYKLAPKIEEKGFKQGTIEYIKENPSEALMAGTTGLLLGVDGIKYALAPEVRVTRTTKNIFGTNPQLFVNPTGGRTIVDPQGKRITEIFYDVKGKGSIGTTISTVNVGKTRKVYDWLGIEPTPIYSSVEGGRNYVLDLIKGKFIDKGSRYQNALKTLTESGISKAEARKMLRQYSKSPTDIVMTGKGKVLYDGDKKPQINLFTDIRYESNPIDIGFGRKSRQSQPFKEKVKQVGELTEVKDGVEIYSSNVDIQKVFYPKGSPEQEFMKLSQRGRTTTRGIQVSSAEGIGLTNLPIATPTKDINILKPFEVYRSESAFRTTSPKSRKTKTGNSRIFTSTDEPTLIDYGQPIKIEPTLTGTKPIPSAQITLTDQQAREFVKSLESIYGKASKSIASSLPKPTISPGGRAPKSSSKSIGKKAGNLLVATSIITLPSVSAYSGKGTYERTNEVASIKVFDNTSSSTRQNESLSTRNKQDLDNSTGTRLVFSGSFDARQRPSTRLAQPVADREAFKLIVGTPSAEGQKIQVPRIRTPQLERTRLQPPIKRPPRVPAPSLDSDWSRRRRTSPIARRTSPKRFTTQIRRRGRWENILTTSNRNVAFSSGERNVRSTLRASFRILEGNTPIKAPLPQGFRYAKNDPFTVVQRRPTRLGTFGERREIRQSRGGFLL